MCDDINICIHACTYELMLSLSSTLDVCFSSVNAVLVSTFDVCVSTVNAAVQALELVIEVLWCCSGHNIC